MFSVGTAGLAIVAQDAGFWTLVSGVIWAPLMVIAYIIRARRRLRAGSRRLNGLAASGNATNGTGNGTGGQTVEEVSPPPPLEP